MRNTSAARVPRFSMATAGNEKPNRASPRAATCRGLLARSAEPSLSTVLGVRDTRFTLNGEPVFLLGISDYGALGAPEDVLRRDLDDLQRHGFNWLRVWATWSAFDRDVSAVDAEGRARAPYLDRLKWLVAECDRRGLVVDVTLTRRDGATDGAICRLRGASGGPSRPWSPRSRSTATGTSTWRTSTTSATHASSPTPSSRRSASRSGGSTRIGWSRPPSAATTSTRRDLKEAVVTIGLDFVCPHRPRNPESPGQTEARTRAVPRHVAGDRPVRPRSSTRSRSAGATPAGSRRPPTSSTTCKAAWRAGPPAGAFTTAPSAVRRRNAPGARSTSATGGCSTSSTRPNARSSPGPRPWCAGRPRRIDREKRIGSKDDENEKTRGESPIARQHLGRPVAGVRMLGARVAE